MAEKEISEVGVLIMPSTKVAALLSQYPALEDVLIALAPLPEVEEPDPAKVRGQSCFSPAGGRLGAHARSRTCEPPAGGGGAA